MMTASEFRYSYHLDDFTTANRPTDYLFFYLFVRRLEAQTGVLYMG